MNPSANEGEGSCVRSSSRESSKVATAGVAVCKKPTAKTRCRGYHLRLRGAMIAAAVAVLLILGTGAAQPAQAQVESVIHSFTGTNTTTPANSDGANPMAGLTMDSSGNLYGTTVLGGPLSLAGELGTVFEGVYNPNTHSYSEKVLPDSLSSILASNPWAGLIRDSKGNLYGTGSGIASTYSSQGGYPTGGGVFEMVYDSSTNSYSKKLLWAFETPLGAEGSNPTGGLVRDSKGDLFGTTLFGGAYGNGLWGTVFELSPAPVSTSAPYGYTEKVLHSFAGYNSTTPASSDGASPYAGLIMDSSGNLYGTTSMGGSSTACGNTGCGTVFELSPDSSSSTGYTEKVLYSFAGYNSTTPASSDGSDPFAGLIMDASGNLYGTTQSGGSSTACFSTGCGTVFELTQASGYKTEKVLYSLKGGASDGATPAGGLIMDAAGNLYGTAETGGSTYKSGVSGGDGTVFELKKTASGYSSTDTVLANFNGANGNDPYAGLTMDAAGNLFGTTLLGGSSTSVQCAGTGCGTVFGIAPVKLSATSLSFGSVGVDTASTAQKVTITNIGGGQFSYNTASISGTNAADFSVINGCSTAIAPSATCSVSVTFTPSTATAETATLNLSQAGMTQTISLTGTGAYATVGVAPGMGFPSQPVGSSSSPQTLTVTNTSSVMLDITSVGITGDFAIASNNCSTVAPSGTCAVGVTFTPTTTGTLTGKLTLNDNTSTGSQSVGLSGTGAITTVSVSPATLSYPLQAVGTKSTDQMVTVMNTGGSTSLAFSSITAGSNFAIDAAKSTCTTSTLVAPGGSCQVAVAFVPTTGGPLTGTLMLTDDASPSTQAVALSGTGAAVSASPTSLTYGSTVVGSTSSAQTVTVTNTGTTGISLTGFTATGNFAVDATGTTCSTSTALAGSASCKVAVTFTPKAVGTETGSLSITSNNAGSATVTLTGTGAAPGVTLNPSSLRFGSTEVGNTSSAQSVMLTNSGNSALTISGLKSSGDFAIDSTGTTCMAGQQVAASKSCTIAVAFSPTAGGTRTGSVTITDNASSSPQTVALSGAGADFTLTARTTSETVPPGGATTFDLLLSPQGGFNQAVSLACSGAPKGATCTVNPTSVTLNGTSSASFGVKVSTTGNAMVGPGPGNFVPPSGSLPLAAWLAILALLVLMALAKFSPKGGRIRRLAPLAALALLITFSVACGGGSSSMSTNSSNTTPAGTYTLQVTGTSGNLSHSAIVTLKVQ